MAELADYLELTVSQARDEFQALLTRRPVPGGRQVVFSPVETLLCLAASFLVNHRHFGGGTAHQAPEPVPSLARLFSRPPSSVLAKMANLDGSRSHGGRWDVLAGALLRDDPARFSRIYRMLLHAARAEGIGPARLPDFLGLEDGGELALLGQEELLRGAIAAAQRNDRHTAHELLNEAGDAGRRLGADANLRWTAFGPTNITLHRVNIAVALGDAGAAIDTARTVHLGQVTVTERKASLLIDTARAFLQYGKHGNAYLALRAAKDIAPEEIAGRPAVRQLVRDLIASAPPSVQRKAQDFARGLGALR